jgi:hypothetical protein
MIPDHQALKERQRKERDKHSEGLALRTHRALSWLKRAEECKDVDGRFIFLWIAFNAAYSQEIGDQRRANERRIFGRFLKKLVDLDSSDVLYELIWSEFPKSIRLLLNNQYVYQPFWDYHNGKASVDHWQASFKRAKASANRALSRHDTRVVLAIVLDRMYTLRNQVMHGGATWNSSVNREQLRDCADFLGKLVPYVIQLMLDNPDTLWGAACYPVVD